MKIARVAWLAATSLLLASAPVARPAGFAADVKLVGAGGAGGGHQGISVAVSADGSTALVGGNGDSSNAGAAWVFTKSGGLWTQQGDKLVGAGATGNAGQGFGVALSADGSTALVGGSGDSSNAGATWVFTRNAGIWTQQGPKLVGTGAVGQATQGLAVALSADGSTALVGGRTDAASYGAAWVFTRSWGTWSQQGAKLVGTGAVGPAWQGYRVALSADGSTALVGGPTDDSSAGAAWVFVRSGGVWTQQGAKLVGTGAVLHAQQGSSVALSADGSTALVGGLEDDSERGAVWAFTRTAGVWTQQGPKLVGTGAVGGARQGWSVALSPDGSTALVGGPNDNSNVGAVWVFKRRSGVWTQQGVKLVGLGARGWSEQGASVALSADGRTALVGGAGDGEGNDSGTGATWVFPGFESGDADGDGGVDVVDVFYLINDLFAGGPAPK